MSIQSKVSQKIKDEKIVSIFVAESLLGTKDGCGIDADCMVPLNRRPTALPASHGEMT